MIKGLAFHQLWVRTGFLDHSWAPLRVMRKTVISNRTRLRSNWRDRKK
jgi:hypothetical protein